MNNDIEVEVRPRPLSTGLWTLFSWLRRDDRSVSSESLSSAGSDRTVASFSFLPPNRYQTAKGPLVVPPPGPPTDSYKKRVHDRNIRRHHDRDITLHRKYGLLKSEGTCSYDAFSLPPRRNNTESGSRWDRDRRATSECYQRRLAHVPGKRRAPLPPVSVAGPSESLARRNTRKRPAPQPPVKLLETTTRKDFRKNHEVNTLSVQMSSNSYLDQSKIRNNDVTVDCKPEKYSKKDTNNKDLKVKCDKSFLKQIFESKKRNSNVDSSALKILPSISELDKQAAELIESCKLKDTGQNNVAFHILDSHNKSETWFCIRCLRKYNSSVASCLFCATNQKPLSSEIVKDQKAIAKGSDSYTQTGQYLLPTRNNDAEDKQKLKKMLKEMKDSLPKRPKHEFNNKRENKSVEHSSSKKNNSTETPTLRIGSTAQDQKNTHFVCQPSTSHVDDTIKSAPKQICAAQQNVLPKSAQIALVTQVISAYKRDVDNNLDRAVTCIPESTAQSEIQTKETIIMPQKQTVEALNNSKILNAPLKISSLLNPMYIPKNLVLDKTQMASDAQIQLKKEIPKVDKMPHKAGNFDAVPSTSQIPTRESDKVITPKLTSTPKEQSRANVAESQNQHSRRRDLINQLEKAIAQGDERAAAEAAAKLAQLRLSCSVLSFSSHILSQPSSSTANNVDLKVKKTEENNVIPTSNKGSSRKINLESQVVKTDFVPENSPPKIFINKPAPSANINVQPKKVVSPFVLKSEIVNAVSCHKEQNEVIRPNVQGAKRETQNENQNKIVTIAVMVEDREATRGPVHLHINRQACIRDLRQAAATSLGVATNLQRWIVGRALCVNDRASIASLAGPDFKAPFYLCVVESETKVQSDSQKNNATASIDTNNQQQKSSNVYTELVQLEQQALVPNAENFECGVCLEEYPPGQGVVLRECVHIFCKDCLSDVVHHCEEPNIPCPAMGCRGMLQEREIRALVSPQDYERWLARGLAAAESGTRNAFHCRTRDCKGWALCEPGVLRFPCPVCKCINCVPCQAIHDGVTCEQYRTKLKQEASKTNELNETDDGTRTLLNSLIRKGEALECPECSAIITKKWGCDWVKCSACKTEICWVTRGRRWGPGGKGDTSGGCRCGVDGKRCHPSCGYCH